MTQPLWFLRQDGKVIGPFPGPQVKEMLHSGAVTLDWDASLDEVDWLSLRATQQFADDRADIAPVHDAESETWHLQREHAQQRWLGDTDRHVRAEVHDKQHDDQTRLALGVDHDRTQTLVDEAQHRRPPILAALISVCLLAALGYAVWVGQQGEAPLQAGITHVANCVTPLVEGANWSGCDKRALQQPGVHARGAHLQRARLDGAGLAEADLSYALLSGASLRNADLQGATLTGADLTGADLTGANLAGARLDFAVLRGAVLEGTRLQDARLGQAAWLDGHVCGEASVGQCQ